MLQASPKRSRTLQHVIKGKDVLKPDGNVGTCGKRQNCPNAGNIGTCWEYWNMMETWELWKLVDIAQECFKILENVKNG